MNNKWNRKNALWMLLYAALYAVVTAAVCVTGSIHPIFFVCYQITADYYPRIPKDTGTRGGCLPVSGYASIAAYHKRCSHVACGSADRYHGSGRGCQGNDKI